MLCQQQYHMKINWLQVRNTYGTLYCNQYYSDRTTRYVVIRIIHSAQAHHVFPIWFIIITTTFNTATIIKYVRPVVSPV